MCSQGRGFGLQTSLETEDCGLGLGVLDLMLISHSWSWSWSWQSVADLRVVRLVLVLNLKFQHCKLIHVTVTRYSKLTR